MKNVIEKIEATLKNDKESLEEFENLEEETTDEHLFEGRIEALEWVLEIIKEERSKYAYPNQLTRQEFEEKIMEFIRVDLGCDIRSGDELLNYEGNHWNHTWVLNIEKDDLLKGDE